VLARLPDQRRPAPSVGLTFPHGREAGPRAGPADHFPRRPPMRHWIIVALFACLFAVGCSSKGPTTPVKTTPEEQKQLKEEEPRGPAAEPNRPRELPPKTDQQRVNEEERRQRGGR